MVAVGLVLAALAAVVHVVIFVLESFAWDTPRARSLFRIDTAEEARTTRFLAFNQGFYNLFLAVLVLLGILLVLLGMTPVGVALVFAGAGSMLAAALVLFITSVPHRGAAVKQGSLPLLAVLILILGLAVHA